jgi:hypothetical protein
MLPQPTTGTLRHCLVRGWLLLLVCALAGVFGALNSSLSPWNPQVAAAPEEEEPTGKDRTVLAGSSHFARRGSIRPGKRLTHRLATLRVAVDPDLLRRQHPATIHQPLTGAGIFQHC